MPRFIVRNNMVYDTLEVADRTGRICYTNLQINCADSKAAKMMARRLNGDKEPVVKKYINKRVGAIKRSGKRK